MEHFALMKTTVEWVSGLESCNWSLGRGKSIAFFTNSDMLIKIKQTLQVMSNLLDIP